MLNEKLKEISDSTKKIINEVATEDPTVSFDVKKEKVKIKGLRKKIDIERMYVNKSGQRIVQVAISKAGLALGSPKGVSDYPLTQSSIFLDNIKQHFKRR